MTKQTLKKSPETRWGPRFAIKNHATLFFQALRDRATFWNNAA